MSGNACTCNAGGMFGHAANCPMSMFTTGGGTALPTQTITTIPFTGTSTAGWPSGVTSGQVQIFQSPQQVLLTDADIDKIARRVAELLNNPEYVAQRVAEILREKD